MKIKFHPLNRYFAAEASPIDLRRVTDAATLAEIRAGMDQYAVLVFRDQALTNEDQLEFAQRLDGVLHTKTGVSALQKNRFGNEALADVSNIDEAGGIRGLDDRRRAYSLANRLWHTDASFQDPPGRYSMLHGRIVPAAGADTEFADMRAAYDALDDARKASLEGLHVHHSIAHSRKSLGFTFSETEEDALRGAVHPLVRAIPRSGRKALYLASHATRIIEMPVPDGRLLLLDLTEHATQRQFVYRHVWRTADLVIWDNRCTMHRATPFEDQRDRRDMRRVTTLDIAL